MKNCIKYLKRLIILILGLYSCNGTTNQNKTESFKKKASINAGIVAKKLDSIQYKISLEKAVYSCDEVINITIEAKNITKKDLKLWIDAGDYPIGSELTLIDSKGEYMVHKYWAEISSKAYTSQEVKQFKTSIPINGTFKKEYPLLSIVQIKRNLSKGVYTLIYNNAEPIKFEIK